MKKLILFVSGFVILGIVSLIVFVELNWDRVYDSPYPDIKASTDSTVIARGKYLVFGPAHCADCHCGENDFEAMEAGQLVPLQGGVTFNMRVGKLMTFNLTPDIETGIGGLTDGEIARAMRDAIGHDGRVLPNFMPFKLMTDEDITAVISFLRSQNPVKIKYQKPVYNRLGKWELSTGKFQPRKIEGTPLKSIKRKASAVYGEYLVKNVANCIGCHSLANTKYGIKEFDFGPFSGGVIFGGQNINTYRFVTPNLTPDKQTGHIANWDENAFVARIKQGRIYKNSPMPWGNYSKMDEMDIRAIYRYLRTVEPIAHKIEKTVYEPGELMPDGN